MQPSPRLSRYIRREMALPTLIGLGAFTFMLLMNALFLIAEKAIGKGLGWGITLQLLGYEVPKLLVLTIPIATLFGTLIGVGRLSSDHEWVAMQSAGLGLGDLLRPVAVHGLLASLACALIYWVVFPHTNYAARTLQAEVYLSGRLGADIRPRVFYTDLPGYVLFVEDIRAGEQGRLDGVLLYVDRSVAEGEFDQLYLAQTGDLYPSPDGSGDLEMELRDGVVHAYRSERPDPYRISGFDAYHLRIAAPPFVEALRRPRVRTVQDMSASGLWERIQQSRSSPDSVLSALRLRTAWLEFHMRIALPLACLLFALLAVPLGITHARSGKAAGFAVSILVILVYWLAFTLPKDQAFQGRIPVWAGAWTANAVVALWALVAYRRVRRSGSRGILGTVVDGLRGAAARRGRSRGGSRGSRPPRGAPNGEPASHRVTTSNRFVGLLDQYVIRQYLRVLLLVLLTAYAVYSIVETKSLLDEVIQNQQPFSLVLGYFKYYAPGMLDIVLPISCLIGSVVTFTLLARNGELTPLLASGLSLRRATVPVLLVNAGLCVVFFLIQDRVTPVTNQKAQEIKDRIQGRSPRSYGSSPTGRWTFGSEGRLYHYRVYDPELNRFQGLGVFTLDFDEPAIVRHRFGKRAVWRDGRWRLEDGWSREFASRGGSEYEAFDVTTATGVDPPDRFARSELSLTARRDLPEQMSLLQLREQILSLRDSGYDTTRLEVAYFVKLAYPATPLVMVLLGLPFAFQIGRRGSVYGIGVALVLVIVYWATFAVFNALGLETLLPPALAAWAPNIVYSLLGFYLILHVRT